MKQIIVSVLVKLFRLVPQSAGRLLFRLWLTVLNKQEPKTAMRALLSLDDDLARQIDQVALRYDSNGIHVKHRLTHYHDFFVERLRSGERVLDIGCGYGAVAYSMATRAKALVIGIDVDAVNIMRARQLFQHSNLTFIHGNALQMVPNEVFDTIVISNVLEHIEHRVEFLKVVQTHLQPQRWLIRVPMINRHWLIPLRHELGMPFFSDPTHYTEYTQVGFESEMEEAGLTITHLQINWGEIWAEVTNSCKPMD